jgi:hypothetical protein
MKILNIKYDPQYDDPVQAYSNCNINSLNMALRMNGDFNKNTSAETLFTLLRSNEAKAYARKLIANGNGWMQWYLDNDQLKQIFSMLNWAARYTIGNGDPEKGKDYSNFFMQIPFGAIRDEIDRGYPVVVSGNFYNLGRTMKYDHVMIVVGYDHYGFVCNDPAGDLFRNANGEIDIYSKYFNKVSGEYVNYPYEWMQQCLNGTRDTKWALFVHADKQNKVEVPLQYALTTYARI